MNKTKLTIGVAITFLLAVSGTYYLAQGDNAYYCNSRDLVMICEKISSGLGTRCYFNDTYKICNSGWIKFEKQEVKVNSLRIKDFVCGNGTLIKECFAEDGSMILRVGI